MILLPKNSRLEGLVLLGVRKANCIITEIQRISVGVNSKWENSDRNELNAHGIFVI